MQLRLTQDEISALKKFDAYHERTGRLFVDINHTNVNVTAFLCFLAVSVLGLGAFGGYIHPVFALIISVCFCAVLFQVGFQFRALAMLAKKQNEYIHFRDH